MRNFRLSARATALSGAAIGLGLGAVVAVPAPALAHASPGQSQPGGPHSVGTAASPDPVFSSHQFVLNQFGVDQGWQVAKHPRQLGDVNGDGRVDIVGNGEAGTYVSLGQANGTFGVAIPTVGDFGYGASAGGWRVESTPRELADINGDGRDDIVGFGVNGVKVALGKTDGTFTASSLVLNQFGVDQGWQVMKHPRQLGDVNSDGRADIVGNGEAGTYVSLGQANGTFSAAIPTVGDFGYGASAGSWRVESTPRELADVNGDGRTDIVGFGANGVKVAWGRTDGAFTASSLVLNEFGTVEGWQVAKHPRQLGDVNGDGRADIVGYGEAGVWVSLAQSA